MEREITAMNEQRIELLKSRIREAKVVSFDIFDTLLFRKTNTPETIFDLVGKHFGIHGFRKIRMDAQNEASARAYAAFGYPHADMDQIYEVLGERQEMGIDWAEVKEYEIRMERDALVANREMLEIFRYAKSLGKRIVITTDMYLTADILSRILRDRGFDGFDRMYCSADEHKAKFNRDLFELVARQEDVAFEDIIHIGDKARDDGEFPEAYGMKSFIIDRDADLEKIKNAGSSDVDKGIYKILCDQKKGFWYNLGVEVGGPIYMALYRYLLNKSENGKKKVFFLARDGYNLYRLFKAMGHENVEYVYTSRRALTLASISRLDEEALQMLPPYTYGQTVGEILDYLGVSRDEITDLEKAGFTSFDEVIDTPEIRERFRNIYLLHEDVFLARCRQERENAKTYFESIGMLDRDGICFDCGWQGSSQVLLERFKKEIGCEAKHPFVYFGIKNGEKSCRQMRWMHYDAYLFDFYRNHALQAELERDVILCELFFSAPHESVFVYDEAGAPVLEQGSGDPEKEQMLEGILDFVREALPFVERYDVEYTPQIAVGHLLRLIHLPTEQEAMTIGDLQNVDGFARKQGQSKFIARVTKEQLEANPNEEIYWPKGLLKRPDIPEEVKAICAERMGVAYPEVIPEYHLENSQDIRSYHRWVRWQQANRQPEKELSYRPKFSVVIPVYNTVTYQLEECIESVLAQTYDDFELILVDDHSTWENVRPVLGRYETHERVRVIYRQTNGHISVATNDGICIADGEFIVFMDCDDTIEPTALYEFAVKLNENPQLDFIYSDEDKITEDGKIRHMPFFKPDWSPDLFLSMMYTNHLATYRTSIVRAVGGLRTAYNGSQDYDFTLRFLEKSDHTRVGHVAKVLYHWRERKESVAYAMTSKNYASEAARCAKEDYIRRNRIPAHLEYIDGMSQYRMVYEVAGAPLLSIIIPSKDHPGILNQCVTAIREFTDYPNYEIVVVDNGSSDENRKVIERILEKAGARYIYRPEEFNFSRMCNTGAANSNGEYLLFLNDDVEVFQSQWLERMLGHAQQKHVGAVGAKLLYPQTTYIQHTGVSNPQEGPLHSFMTLDDRYPYYFGWNRVDHDCIGVTGACLLVQREKFREAGCFDEDLPVTYNDVKLCFALHELGYYNVMRTDVVAYHHESLSRGSDQIDDRKLIRMNAERAGLFARFPALRNRDPYMNENLTRWSAGLDLKRGYDVPRKLELTNPVEDLHVSVDSIEVTNRIQILGWSVLGGQPCGEEQERYLIFRDPFGQVFGCRVQAMERQDVANYFACGDYLMSGFECILPKNALRVDILPYRVGVMVIGADGMQHIAWNRETDILRNARPRPAALPFGEPEEPHLRENAEGIQWYVDTCAHQGVYRRISGFAFKRGSEHHHYSNSLVLRGDDGTLLEFEVYPEERVDVAYAFPEEHYLFYTGFAAYVYDKSLAPGVEYEVIIRLTNSLDPEDIRDVVTGTRFRA